MLIPELDHSANGGFRLHQFELLNWGTFDRQIWTIDLQGKMALLTGVNGSGKSTLVDGLLTLLVPNRKRNYNQASSSGGKKERDEKSYIQGAYGSSRRDDEYGSTKKFLRDKEKKKISILLAYFYNEVSQKELSLAQVLWIKENEVKKFYIIHEQKLTIQTHFSFADIDELKKHLKEKGAEIFTEFTKYCQSFLRIFGFQSTKALDLFNQTVSLKEIKSINEFVRNQMLQKEDVQSRIEKLEQFYDNLTVIHSNIKKAKDQLDLLDPIEEQANNLNKIRPEIAKFEALIKIAPAYFASIKVQLLQEKLELIKQNLIQANVAKETYTMEFNNLDQQKSELNIAISKNSATQRLNELEKEIKSLSNQIIKQKNKAESYNKLTQLLGFSEYSNQSIFEEIRTVLIPQKIREITQIINDLTLERDGKLNISNNLNNSTQVLKDELKSLKQRKNLIPDPNLRVRNQIVKALNLQETDLPFIGELLQIREDEKEWEGVIQTLLKGFGLTILVPDLYYQKVSRYVNENKLKGKVVYYPVKKILSFSTQRNFRPHTVPSKLDIKKDHQVFYDWLVENLNNSYSYICCDNLEQFNREKKAITKNGLIKHNNGRHEKDDRQDLNNPRNYVLGWSNEAKIKELEKDLGKIEKDLAQINQEIKLLEQEKEKTQKQDSGLQNLNNFDDFSDIDWLRSQSQLELLKQEKSELLTSSDQLQQLKKQLTEVESKINLIKEEQYKIATKIGSLSEQEKNYESGQNQAQNIADQFSEAELNQFQFTQSNRLKRYKLTLDTISQDQDKIIGFIKEELNSFKNQERSFQSSITTQMVNFKNKFAEDTSEIGSNLEYLPEYLNLIKTIKYQDLPRYEERFKEKMNKDIIQSIVHFKQFLEDQETTIKEDIDELNHSLQQISYSDSTYIQLQCDKTKDEEIKDFKHKDLQNCISNFNDQSSQAQEQRFISIKALINQLKGQDRWREKVTDVRNWLDFSVSECYRENDEPKAHYSESSGLSGGQKAKLAYTVLASAIAHQFGLNQNNSDRKSFRFVVIDEAFSKLDDNNACYAMDLFKKLNLQLLVVTPKDKIHVIEDYINSIHLVSNTSAENYSSIQTISMQQFKAYQQD